MGRGSKPALLGAAFAPIRALMEKLAKKPAKNRQKSDEKWRQMALFRVPERQIIVRLCNLKTSGSMVYE
jgi:hypothetical protein